MANEVELEFPPKLAFLFKPKRYKVAHGGRGGAKSWGFARALLILATQKPLRILCAREVQKSIKESVHKLLQDQIQALGLGRYWEVQQTVIIGSNGSTISFTGLAQHTVESVKSYEGCDIVWVEEAQTVSKKSWDILIPTIRKEGSEIWVSLNPDLDSDDTYKRFIEDPPENAEVVQINWQDNPWFPSVLEIERVTCQQKRPKDYPNIWEGKCKTVVDGAIYADEVMELLERRVTRVSYDPMLRVHAIFDLGWNDCMSIILVQRAASELRIIGYIEDNHKTLDWYSDELKRLNYNWGKVWLPHDGVTKDYKTGKSAQEIMQAFGWTVEIIPVGDIEHGIKLGRMLFPRLWADKENTARLLECLKRYRRAINANTNEPGSPLHDEYSHGADAYRYLATCADSLTNDALPPKQIHRPLFGGAQGWMG